MSFKIIFSLKLVLVMSNSTPTMRQHGAPPEQLQKLSGSWFALFVNLLLIGFLIYVISSVFFGEKPHKSKLQLSEKANTTLRTTYSYFGQSADEVDFYGYRIKFDQEIGILTIQSGTGDNNSNSYGHTTLSFNLSGEFSFEQNGYSENNLSDGTDSDHAVTSSNRASYFQGRARYQNDRYHGPRDQAVVDSIVTKRIEMYIGGVQQALDTHLQRQRQ